MRILPVLLLLIFVACRQTAKPLVVTEKRDSLVDKQLLLMSDVSQADTNDSYYQLLSAYRSNDTVKLSKQIETLEKERQYQLRWKSMDSCIHEPSLQDLHVDEAYRFIYLAPFCYDKIHLTVSRKKDSASMHFILYQFKWDTAACRVISVFDKKLSIAQWETFTDQMRQGDFWGLKPENGLHGVDGSTLEVTGYIVADPHDQRQPRSAYVSRWVYSTLREPFTQLLKWSGNKKGCYWVQSR